MRPAFAVSDGKTSETLKTFRFVAVTTGWSRISVILIPSKCLAFTGGHDGDWV